MVPTDLWKKTSQRALPVWLGWIGVAAGIIALASIVFFPWFLIALWLLVASAILFAAGSPRRTAATSYP